MRVNVPVPEAPVAVHDDQVRWSRDALPSPQANTMQLGRTCGATPGWVHPLRTEGTGPDPVGFRVTSPLRRRYVSEEDAQIDVCRSVRSTTPSAVLDPIGKGERGITHQSNRSGVDVVGNPATLVA